MRLVIQRVIEAAVTVDGKLISSINNGLLILVGIGESDTKDDVEWLVAKTANMRIFNDDNGVMNRSLLDIGCDALAVSQFTLLASTKKGNRPSYIHAAKHELAIPMYEMYCKRLSETIGRPVGKGVFGADMKVSLVNDGPVTIVIDSHLRE